MSFQTPEKFETTIETYLVDKVIGEGGTGRVFLVHDSRRQNFAVKCLFPEFVSTAKFGRFKNELRFLLKNKHENILSIVDYGLLLVGEISTPFYIMPDYPTTLRTILNKGLSSEKAFELFNFILAGIEESHSRGIWHRDLKPENILLNPITSSLVIADFGIANFSEEDLYTAVKTQQSERLANFLYAAPEQRVKGNRVDNRADIYALGLILAEMYTSEVPIGTGYKKVSETIPSFGYLDEIIDRMIRHSPNQRPGSINEIRLELSLRKQQTVNPKQYLDETKMRNYKKTNKKYQAEIDCVGRIEDEDNPSVLSISAGLSYSLMVSAEVKQFFLNYLTKFKPNWGKKRRCIFLYSIILFLLIKDQIKKLDMIIIDPEYLGYEPIIKQKILHLLKIEGLQARPEKIVFRRIERQSPARIMASRIYRGFAEPDNQVTDFQLEILLQRKGSGP